MPRIKIDSKDVIIGVLSFFVLCEAYFLFAHKPKKMVPLKEVRAASTRPVEEKPLIAPPLLPTEQKAITKKPITARVAIIVDDCGYSLLTCKFSESIKNPVTFSILPGLKHSIDAATCAHQNSKEVMLHLPMEAHHNDDKYPEDYIITTSMKKSKVLKIITDALASAPFASGVNNHMGSKATEDKTLMGIVFSALMKKQLFFVDSLVTEKSVCRKLAETLKLPFAERNIFLDNKNERGYIEGQFAQLAQIARKNGFAIAIGHARRLTLEIIKEETELLSQEGIEFVTVNDIITKQNEYLRH